MKLGQNVCLDEILDKFKMGHVCSKTRSLGQILEKTSVLSRVHLFNLIPMKLVRMFVSMKSRRSSKMGHFWSKTRSLGLIIEELMLVTKGL